MFIRIKLITFVFICGFLLEGCQEDLFPSNDSLADPWVGKTVEDLEFTLTTKQVSSLSERLQNSDAIVLYFTMWCTTCEGHMIKIKDDFHTKYSNIDFIFVDYIEDTIAGAYQNQQANNYTTSNVIADYDDKLENYLGGTMATTIVINKNFTVLMNEEFKTGSQLALILDSL